MGGVRDTDAWLVASVAVARTVLGVRSEADQEKPSRRTPRVTPVGRYMLAVTAIGFLVAARTCWWLLEVELWSDDPLDVLVLAIVAGVLVLGAAAGVGIIAYGADYLRRIAAALETIAEQRSDGDDRPPAG